MIRMILGGQLAVHLRSALQSHGAGEVHPWGSDAGLGQFGFESCNLLVQEGVLLFAAGEVFVQVLGLVNQSTERRIRKESLGEQSFFCFRGQLFADIDRAFLPSVCVPFALVPVRPVGETFATTSLTGALAARLNFATAPALVTTRQQGAHVGGGRMTPQYLPLWTRAGSPFDLVAALRTAGPYRQLSLAVYVRDARSGEELAVGIHALHLTAPQCNRAQRQAQRWGRTAQATTLFLSAWVLVLTTLPPDELGAEDILELYRIRWQVELVIKRYKSLLSAARVRAKRGSPLALVYLASKLLFALLVERRALARLGNEWTQRLQLRQATWWRRWNLIAQEVPAAVLDTARWSVGDWPAVLRALAERKRTRQLQVLPPAVAHWLRTTPWCCRHKPLNCLCINHIEPYLGAYEAEPSSQNEAHGHYHRVKDKPGMRGKLRSSRVATVEPVAKAVAAMSRSWAPTVTPLAANSAHNRACTRATTTSKGNTAS